jgi:hypothetical protein
VCVCVCVCVWSNVDSTTSIMDTQKMHIANENSVVENETLVFCAKSGI